MAKPTIRELEAILSAEEDTPIEILPNGEIRQLGQGAKELTNKKPLTMREDLGGEYGGKMDLQRIRSEFAAAQAMFPNIELASTTDGKPMVLALLQTTAGKLYSISIYFPENYPIAGPTIFFRQPVIQEFTPHRYKDGSMCYMLPRMWNPGRHNLTFVVGRAAKWLNKYEVWLATQRWPGAQLAH